MDRVGRCIFWLEVPEASPGSVLGDHSRQCSEDHTVLLGLPSAPFLSSAPLRLSLLSQTYLYMIGFPSSAGDKAYELGCTIFSLVFQSVFLWFR